MSELILVAATGLARDVMAVVRSGEDFDLLGILDEDPARTGGALDGAHILGGLDQVRRYPQAHLAVCLENGAARAGAVARLARLGVGPNRFATIVHPSAAVPEGCTVGEGSIILANVVMTAAVTLGRHVVAMPRATFAHGDVAEDYTTFGAAAVLGAYVTVGRASCLGLHSSVRHHCRIGAGALIANGAAVISDVHEDQIVAGVPAHPIAPGPEPLKGPRFRGKLLEVPDEPGQYGQVRSGNRLHAGPQLGEYGLTRGEEPVDSNRHQTIAPHSVAGLGEGVPAEWRPDPLQRHRRRHHPESRSEDGSELRQDPAGAGLQQPGQAESPIVRPTPGPLSAGAAAGSAGRSRRPAPRRRPRRARRAGSWYGSGGRAAPRARNSTPR